MIPALPLSDIAHNWLERVSCTGMAKLRRGARLRDPPTRREELMRSRVAAITFLSLLYALAVFAQQGNTPQGPPTDTVAPDIPGVVRGGTAVQVVRDGFDGTEGPIALPDGSVIFTENAASRIVRIDTDGNISTFLENTNGTNSLALDARGRLIALQRGGPGKPQIGVIYPQGQEAVLADNFEGQPFNRPNDLVVDKKGGVYFTEPPAMPPTVYYIPADGTVVKATDTVERPNGVQLNRDETTLYVNSGAEFLIAFDVEDDGSLTNRRNFARYQNMLTTENGTASGADGLAIDSQGRVYVATNGGVEVFSETGQHLGTIPFSRKPQNLAFAGPEKRTLYVVGRGTAFKVDMLAQGFMGRAK
jgi:gluconolactonase